MVLSWAAERLLKWALFSEEPKFIAGHTNVYPHPRSLEKQSEGPGAQTD